MKIYIRADGGRSIGMGHIMRMLVLGKQLKKKNEVIFLCREDNRGTYKAGIEKIKENDFDVIKLDSCNVIRSIATIQNKSKADMLITDSYDVNTEYFNELKKVFPISGYIDDVNKCYMNVDFLINQNINAKYMDYSKTTPMYTKLFLGPKYSMIRDEFKIYESNKVIKKADVEDILLTLGGMDCNENTLKVLRRISRLRQRIHVALGSAFDKRVKESLYSYKKDYTNIYLYENANMSALMNKCGIAISACGSTLYELCAMKVPAIGIILADNQKEFGMMMKKEKIIFDVFDIENVENEEFSKSVDKLVRSDGIRRLIKENCENIVNVYGSDFLSESIEKYLKFGEW